jgi:cold shock CspA family protein
MIGKVTYWNQPKGFGFITITEQRSLLEAPSQTQYFFHHSQFTKGEVPVLGAYVVFTLGEPYAAGRKVQAVGVRFANAQEITASLPKTASTVIAGIDVLMTTLPEGV